MGGFLMGILQDKRRVIEVPLEEIIPNPAQPRRTFPEKELLELSRSIKQNGLLQPLSVRRTKDGYELIAGERRLRACRMAGLDSVSCIVNACSDKQSAVLAMTENLQRQDLQIFEEAEGIRRLIEEWGVTQEEAALRLGKSQSTLANKLRLLRLTQEERKKISEAGLTERHARALLRIEDSDLRGKALQSIIDHHFNVQQTDEYIEKLLSDKEEKPKSKRRMIVKDVRIFMNTINHAIKTMQMSGIQAKTIRNETDEYIECVVRIPKTASSRVGAGGNVYKQETPEGRDGKDILPDLRSGQRGRELTQAGNLESPRQKEPAPELPEIALTATA